MLKKYCIVLTDDMSDFASLKMYIQQLDINAVEVSGDKERIVRCVLENKPEIVAFNGTTLGIDGMGEIVDFVTKAELSPVYFNMHFSDYTNEEIQHLLDKGIKFNIHAPCDSREIAHFFYYICLSKGYCPSKLQQNALELMRDTFNRIGVRCIYKGRDYIIAMLYKILFESENIPTIKSLYEYCSEKFGVPTENIRKAVDTVVATCWKGLTKEKKIERYGAQLAEKQKISNFDFIQGLAKYIYQEFYVDFHKYHNGKNKR